MSSSSRPSRYILTAASLVLAAAAVACSNDHPVAFSNPTNNSNQSAPSVISPNSGSAQTATIPTLLLPIALTARVVDQNDRAMDNVTVTWATKTGSGTVTPATSLTNDDGIATAFWTTGSGVGTNIDTATASTPGAIGVALGLPYAIFTATVKAGPFASIFKVAGDTSNIAAGTGTVVLTVQTTDAAGNPVSAKPVFAVATGGGTLSATTVTTSSTTGQGSVTFTAPAVAGVSTVTVTLSPATTVTFTITSH